MKVLLFLINCKLMVETINLNPNETDTFQAVSLVEVKLITSESRMVITLTQPGFTTDTTSTSLTLTTSAVDTADTTIFTTTSIEMTTLTTTTTETTTLTITTTELELLLDDGSFHLLNNSFGPDAKTGLRGEVVPVLGNGSFREDLDDELRESYPNAGNHSISRQQLEHIRSITGRNISELDQEAMCSSTAYCVLSKENSDYPKLSPQQQSYMCHDKNDAANLTQTRGKIRSNCKYSDPQNFNFVNKELCVMFEEQMTILQDEEPHNTGLECYFALICDSILPEGCGFLTHRFSIWLIVFSTVLQ